MVTISSTLQHNLQEFLRQYRTAPHATTGSSPAQLFLGRAIRTKLDLTKPSESKTKKEQSQQSNANTTFREFDQQILVYFLSGNS